jgi:hypothetical protein
MVFIKYSDIPDSQILNKKSMAKTAFKFKENWHIKLYMVENS